MWATNVLDQNFVDWNLPRHNFLNNLQVIAGFVLRKKDIRTDTTGTNAMAWLKDRQDERIDRQTNSDQQLPAGPGEGKQNPL